VHPWPGRALGLLTVASLQSAGAAALTPTLVALSAAADEWIEVLAGDISHDSATAVNVQARLFNTVLLLSTFIARWTVMDTALSTLGGFQPLFGNPAGAFGAGKTLQAMQRPLIIPPSYDLRFDGQTAGVAYTLTASLVLVRHKVHDNPVSL
jgi:hypothetical protein